MPWQTIGAFLRVVTHPRVATNPLDAATANLIPDAQLAALAIELGVPLASNDSDFARFPACRWFNPLA